MTNTSSGWVKARNKITDGTDWRGTATVPLGGDVVEIGHRLLTESEFFEVKQAIDVAELKELKDNETEDIDERLRELQSKDEDELTETEKSELRDLSEKMAVRQSEIEQKIGEDVNAKLMWAGKRAIAPTEDDVSAVMNDLELQQEMFGEAIQGGKKQFEERLKADMQETVDGQPYPIKYMIGQKAFEESMKLLGNETTNG